MAKSGDNNDPEEGEDDKKRLPEPDEGDEDTSASRTEEEEGDEPETDGDESDEDESDEDESDESDAGEPETDAEESDEDEDEDESNDDADEDEDEQKAAAGEIESAGDDADEDEGDDAEEEAEEQERLPAHLGAQKYVYSAFFTGSILFAYILGRTLETIWARLAAWDTAVDAVPSLAVVADDEKLTYSLFAGGLIAVLVALRTFRKSTVRTWAEEVAAELVKVKWPTRKDVYGSTVVVLATSAIAVTYLFLLDRFWGFVTNLIYGSGT